MVSEYRVLEKLNKTSKNILKYVSVSSSSVYKNTFSCCSQYNLLKSSDSYYYHSDSGVGQWVRFDFTVSAIKINGFEVTVSKENRDPLNWRLEGSNNGVVFSEIYTNNKPMCNYKPYCNGFICDAFKTNRYNLSSPVTYSSFRFITTGESSVPGDNWLTLSRIEFIGLLIEPIHLPSCTLSSSNILSIIFIVITLES